MNIGSVKEGIRVGIVGKPNEAKYLSEMIAARGKLIMFSNEVDGQAIWEAVTLAATSCTLPVSELADKASTMLSRGDSVDSVIMHFENVWLGRAEV